MMAVMVSREARVQRSFFVGGAVLATIVWVGVITYRSQMPICMFFSALAILVMYFVVKSELVTAEGGGSPEHTLRRLKRAKSDVTSRLKKDHSSRSPDQ